MQHVRMWASPRLGKRGHYPLFVLGSMGGIVLLCLLLCGGGAILLLPLGEKKALPSLALCLGTAFLMGLLALWAGRKSAMEATLFFQDPQGQLYVLDARQMGSGRLIPFVQGVMETQRILAALAQEPRIPPGARPITQVEALVPHRSYVLLRCARQGGVYFLSRDLPGAEELLSLLERGKGPAQARQSPGHVVGLGVSGALFLAFSLLAALCHPAWGALPRPLYYPCLLLALGAFFALVTFALRRHRGL